MVAGDLCKNNLGDYGVIRHIDACDGGINLDIFWTKNSSLKHYILLGEDHSSVRCDDGNTYPTGLLFQYIGGDTFKVERNNVPNCICYAPNCVSCQYKCKEYCCRKCGEQHMNYRPSRFCPECGRKLVSDVAGWDRWQSVKAELCSRKRLSDFARDYLSKLMELEHIRLCK